MLAQGDYAGYNQHCVDAKSDHRDAGQVMRAVRGPMRPKLSISLPAMLPPSTKPLTPLG
jgi:hypothetical protein